MEVRRKRMGFRVWDLGVGLGEEGGGGTVDVEGGVRMEAEDRGGACGRDRALHGGAHGVGFSRTGDVNTEAFRLAENGDGEGERVERYVGEGGEAAVVDLLLAAAEVELDDFYEVGVFEVGHGRIVESDVAIFANAQADEIDGFFLEEGGVLGGDGGGIGLFGGEGVEPRDGDVAQEVLLKVVTKTLWVGGGQADVVVHVKRGNARPIESETALGGVDESCEELVLRRSAGEDDAGFALAGDDAVEVGGDGARSGAPEGGTVGVDFDCEAAGGEIVRSGDGHGG